jgi:hypothetical protein
LGGCRTEGNARARYSSPSQGSREVPGTRHSGQVSGEG